MKVTFLKEIPTTRGTMETFGGYDHRTRIAEGNFFDECNLSDRDYPVMATRRERVRLADIEGLQGVLVKDSVAWVASNKLYYDGEEVPELTVSNGEKQLISMGTYIIIYPDMLLYNVVTKECEQLLATNTISGMEITTPGNLIKTFAEDAEASLSAKRYSSLPDGYPMTEDGEQDGNYTPTEGSLAYYSKYSNSQRTYYEYINGRFLPAYNCFVIRFDFGKDVGYTTDDEGNEYEEWYLSSKQEKEIEYLQTLENAMVLWKGLEEKLTCPILKIDYTPGEESDRVSVYVNPKRSITEEDASQWSYAYRSYPILDGLFENGNRLWGWRRGEAMNGEFVNEIYATALGDPRAWDTFDGIASDSFAATVGSDGPFTGAAYFSGCMYFFKETCFHRVMGNKPANYQITTFSCHGVEEGSERSLVVVGDAMYYKGVDGIYCYDGSVPYKISDAFGDKKYKNAVGGVLGDRIFFDMEDDTGARSVFVYDTAKKLWHVEDSIGAKQFVPAYGNLIAMTEGGLVLVSDEVVDDTLTRLFGQSMAREGAFSWFGEFGDFGLSDPDAKYVSKLLLRMTVDEGARMTVEVMCDSDGSWRTAAVVSAKNKKSWCLPVVTPRCDHFRLRLSGVGGFKLWTLTREIESTNEVRR